MKLVPKISISIFIVTLAAILMIGWTSFIFTKEVMQNAISKNQREMARETMDKIDRLLYERYTNIRVFAQRPDFLNTLKNCTSSSFNFK